MTEVKIVHGYRVLATIAINSPSPVIRRHRNRGSSGGSTATATFTAASICSARIPPLDGSANSASRG